MLGPARASLLPKSPTYWVNVRRNVPRNSGDARAGEAAINHEGQGVGTEPIFKQQEDTKSGVQMIDTSWKDNIQSGLRLYQHKV